MNGGGRRPLNRRALAASVPWGSVLSRFGRERSRRAMVAVRSWQCLFEEAIMRQTIGWLLLTCMIIFPSLALSTLAATHKGARGAMRDVPAYYVDALQTAGQFLAAWRSGDVPAGEGLLSDHLARSTPDKDWIRQFFHGLST